MGANSKIEWTTHTFNPWWGCVKVSPGCANCYAETFSKRTGHDVWGPAKTTPRRQLSEAHWQKPLAWNDAAKATGGRARVFCASMADVFEDHPGVTEARARLWALIDRTQHLDWQLLTKRPENVMRMIPGAWKDGLPSHVWIGASVEDQQRANERIPRLLTIPARIRFLSCEPLLGPVDFSRVPDPYAAKHAHHHPLYVDGGPCIHWVIVGGESGPGARPVHPDWARSLRDQCQAAGVPFFFKQWGAWAPDEGRSLTDGRFGYWQGNRTRVDSVLYEAPTGEVFVVDTITGADRPYMVRVGKSAAGRLLDGREWNEMPAGTPATA